MLPLFYLIKRDLCLFLSQDLVLLPLLAARHRHRDFNTVGDGAQLPSLNSLIMQERLSTQRCTSCCKLCDCQKMPVLKQTIRGGHGAPWFCPTFIGMPEHLFLLVVQFEDPGTAKTLLNDQHEQTLVLSNTQIVVISFQFPHRFESEDYAKPWFCLTPRQLSQVISSSIGLSPRTIQDFGSV